MWTIATGSLGPERKTRSFCVVSHWATYITYNYGTDPFPEIWDELSVETNDIEVLTGTGLCLLSLLAISPFPNPTRPKTNTEIYDTVWDELSVETNDIEALTGTGLCLLKVLWNANACWLVLIYNTLIITNVAKRLFKYVPYIFYYNVSVNFLQSTWIRPQKNLPNQDSCCDITCQSPSSKHYNFNRYCYVR